MEFIANGETTKVEGGQGAITPGTYFLWIIDDPKEFWVKRGQSLSGNKCINFCFQILNNNQHRGKRFYESFYTSSTIVWRYQELYFAIEQNEGDRISKFDLDNDDLVHHALFYRPFCAEVTEEEYNGKKRLSIKKFYPLTEEDFAFALDQAEALLGENKSGKGPRENNPFAVG